ncbi:testicular haploid expressed gene protein isoform X2 [Suricata suricatta]|uniref:testicular haploid expressed gene protein isoform X2 n=1 Tax=Suricata suricatta TaxID=37032 RepID=UPI0011555350|nr:testicular haploid expressed gene protein isoform X2 [Suricata suricatta]
MEDHRQSLFHSHRSSGAQGRPDWGQARDAVGVQGAVTKDTAHLDEDELRFEDQEEETLPEEVTGEELPGPGAPEEALEQLERVLEKNAEEGIPEMSRLSISQRLPSASSARSRKRRRAFELAKPKTNWQVLRDRPSVYWTERFLEDTTLTITVPAVTHRVEELARPKRFYSEYFNNDRTTGVWPIPRRTLEYQASNRLRELAAPRSRHNIWSINMCEYLFSRTVHGAYTETLFHLWDCTLPHKCSTTDPQSPTDRAPACFQLFARVFKPRCPEYRRQPRGPSPAQGSYSWQSPGPPPPCWKSGTPCQNPSHTCQTIIASFFWPCLRPSQTSVFLTEIRAGRCWTSPRRRWPVPGPSPWPSRKCAKTSTRATTPTAFLPRPWWLGHPLACTS